MCRKLANFRFSAFFLPIMSNFRFFEDSKFFGNPNCNLKFWQIIKVKSNKFLDNCNNQVIIFTRLSENKYNNQLNKENNFTDLNIKQANIKFST